MNRRAILIGAPNAHGMAALGGVPKDIANYRRFLVHSYGGAWVDDEIVRLTEPSSHELHLQLQRPADYTLVVFSGHGEYRDQASHVSINPDESIEAGALRTVAPKQVIILDTCRYFEPILAGREKVGGIGVGEPFDEYRAACRAAFDAAVARAPVSTEFFFACSVGETASDGEGTGGLFSSCLLRAAYAWAENARVTRQHNPQRGVLSVAEVFAKAKVDVESRNRPGLVQHPDWWAHRGSVHCPFAVA